MNQLISWNVNGIRAAEKKGLFTFLQETSPDILCLQETKAKPEQLTKTFLEQEDYSVYFASAEKPGYSGTAVYTKREPLSVSTLGIEEFDREGRALLLEYPEYVLINTYFPNSQPERKRIEYKLNFCDAVLNKCEELVQSGKQVILCGDYNIAHKPIDLARPKDNENNPGYLPEERAWMDTFTGAGYLDTFREFNQEPENYTWWTYRFKAREKNIGWRLDYFSINKAFREALTNAEILSDVYGSDHCPVNITLDY
jgi:exodeoxyribonuclease III